MKRRAQKEKKIAEAGKTRANKAQWEPGKRQAAHLLGLRLPRLRHLRQLRLSYERTSHTPHKTTAKKKIHTRSGNTQRKRRESVRLLLSSTSQFCDRIYNHTDNRTPGI